jgi:hypothetical protein
MKRRADGKPERGDEPSTQPFSSDAAVRAGDFGGVRVSEPQAGTGALEIHRVVAVFVPADRHRDRLGDVSIVSMKRTSFPRMN